MTLEQLKEEARRNLKSEDVNGFTVYSGLPLDIDTLITTAYEAGLTANCTALCEGLEALDEYMAVTDNDSHRYQIPRTKKAEWDAFCEIPEDDERSWDVPAWAERIDGMPVKSFKEQAIALIRTTLTQNSNQK